MYVYAHWEEGAEVCVWAGDRVETFFSLLSPGQTDETYGRYERLHRKGEAQVRSSSELN